MDIQIQVRTTTNKGVKAESTRKGLKIEVGIPNGNECVEQKLVKSYGEDRWMVHLSRTRTVSTAPYVFKLEKQSREKVSPKLIMTSI